MAFVDHAPDRQHGGYGALAVFLGLTLGVGALGGFATSSAIPGWYSTSRPMALFAIQLVLNCAWSFIFFGAHDIGAALAEVLVLLVFIFWTAISFGWRDRIAAWLFAPYLAWVCFATLLNAAFWQIN